MTGLCPFLSPAVLCLIALLPGCAVGPDFAQPAPPDAAGYTAEALPHQTQSARVADGEAQRFVRDMDIPAQWWTLFHSAPLDALVGQSLRANPTIDSARAALRQAQENVKAQIGAYFPSVQSGFTGQREKNAVQPSPTLATYVPYFNLYNAQVSVSYTFDLWGGNRREVESLEAQADAARFELEAAYLTLTTNVVTAAIQDASLHGQIAATNAVIDAQSRILDLMRRQLALGQISDIDLSAQETVLAQARATLPPLQKQLAQQRDLLAVLVGGFPDKPPEATFELSSLQLPPDIPVSLPSKLVEQRPDIRAAEEELRSANAQIGVAIANMLPNLTLSAADGTTATKLGQLFQAGNGYWDVIGGLTQPVFDGGTLLHKRRAADAAFDQAAAQYKSTVLTAFQNVADALRAIQSDADAVNASAAAEQASARNLARTKTQWELGGASFQSVLTAEQTYQQTVIALVQAEAARLADTAALFQALGGGWWNRPAQDGDGK